MVQTLSGSWYLWLVPLFVICVAVMIPASLNELGMTRKARKEEAKAKAEAKQKVDLKSAPAPVASVAADQNMTEEDELLQVVLMAAAAYVTGRTGQGGNAMRNLKITVNGKTYDVTVEEEGGSYNYKPRYPATRPAPTPTAAPAPQKAAAATSVAPAIPKPKAKAPENPDGIKLEAPLSGKIVEIVAKEGTAVKAGDTVIIMEAMKLQSEICAESDGTVSKIFVTEKQNVLTGDALAIIS